MERMVTGKAHRLGILGGGQLGRMFIQAAINYDIHVHIMDNGLNTPSSAISNTYTEGDITNYDDVLNFGKDKDIITVEIENVNVEALKQLAIEGKKIFPQPVVLEIIKDKGLQKQFYIENNIPTSNFSLTNAETDKNELLQKIPFIHKLRTGGYDGKGVEIIRKPEDLKNTFKAPAILEELVPFEKEISIIVARNEQGETAVYQSVECEFNDANLVSFLFSPAAVSAEIEQKATTLAIEVINKFKMVGILAVEMFLTPSGELLVNEVAPRPHNSGHHTIECNITSQFEQHLRSIMNFPLGCTDMVRSGAMINLIGEIGHTGKVRYDGLTEIIRRKGVHVHLYGKEETKANRKMGHVTVALSELSEAKKVATEIKDLIRVISES